jgi:hypothetical protein
MFSKLLPLKPEFDRIYATNSVKYNFGLTTELDTKHFATDIVKNVNVCIVESLQSKSNFSVEIENHKIYKHDIRGLATNNKFIQLKKILSDLKITINMHKHENKYVYCKYRIHYNFDNKNLDIYL